MKLKCPNLLKPLDIIIQKNVDPSTSQSHLFSLVSIWDTLYEVHLPEHAWGGKGNISVVELFLLATAQPRLWNNKSLFNFVSTNLKLHKKYCHNYLHTWGLKFLNCCMKSELSIKAMSAKCKSHKIWFLNLRALFWLGPERFIPQLLHFKHSSW